MRYSLGRKFCNFNQQNVLMYPIYILKADGYIPYIMGGNIIVHRLIDRNGSVDL